MGLWMGLWALGAAIAAGPIDEPVADGELFVAMGDEVVAVSTVSLPRLRVRDPRERTCRVVFEGREDGVALSLPDCPERLAPATKEAAERWVFSGSLEGRSLEVWFRYPIDEPEVPATVGLLVAPTQAWTSSVPGVEVLRARPRTTPVPAVEGAVEAAFCCPLRHTVTATGLSSRPLVGACPHEGFAAALAEAAISWRFEPPTWAGEPSTVSFLADVCVEGDGAARLVWPAAMVVQRVDAAPKPATLPPEPTGKPRLVAHHPGHAAVEVFDVVWPELPPLDRVQRCALVWQVDTLRRVSVSVKDCDEALVEAALDAASRWSMRPGRAAPGERTAQLHGTFVVGPGAEPRLSVPKDELQVRRGAWGDRLTTHRSLTVRERGAPTPRADERLVTGACATRVRVTRRGRPADIRPEGCATSLAGYATRAVYTWRWWPEIIDGRRVDAETTVVVRLGSAGPAM